MPVLTGQLEADGAFVNIRISLSRPEMMRRRAAGQPIPQPIALRAALDSGAEFTCFNQNLLGPLNLPLRGVSLVNAPGLGGLSLAPQHDVGLTILHHSGTAALNLVIPELPILEMPLRTVGCDGVIGRDVLDRCLFVYNGPARTFALGY
jgi:hypothetical protein